MGFIRKISYVLILLLAACSSLPTKEVQFAGKELERAKNNQGPELAKEDFDQAAEAFKKATEFLKKKKGDEAKKQSLQSIDKSRSSIIQAKDTRVLNAIDKVEKRVAALEKSQLNDKDLKVSSELVKSVQDKLEFLKQLQPIKKKIQEAKDLYQEAKAFVPSVQKNIRKTEILKELASYIEAMDKAYAKVQEAETVLAKEEQKLKEALQAEMATLNQLKEMKDNYAQGLQMVSALAKDQFVIKFYNDRREKVVADFEVFRKAYESKNLEEAEKNKDAYNRLLAFFNEMRDLKLALNQKYKVLSQKMLDKITGFYKKDAESYLEKAQRLRQEVYRLYGRDQLNKTEVQPENVDPERIEKKIIPVIKMKPALIKQSASQENRNPEATNERGQKELSKEMDDDGNNEDELSDDDIKKEKSKKDEPEKKETKTSNSEEKKTAVKKQPSKNPEDAMINQLDNLYNDAQSLFKKEEYTTSIEKAKQSIELAQKMIALKKAMQKKPVTVKPGKTVHPYTITIFKRYKVKRRDYLWKIAMRKSTLGKAYLWPLIWYANKDKVKNPHRIYPGTVLKIPVFSQP